MSFFDILASFGLSQGQPMQQTPSDLQPVTKMVQQGAPLLNSPQAVPGKTYNYELVQTTEYIPQTKDARTTFTEPLQTITNVESPNVGPFRNPKQYMDALQKKTKVSLIDAFKSYPNLKSFEDDMVSWYNRKGSEIPQDRELTMQEYGSYLQKRGFAKSEKDYGASIQGTVKRANNVLNILLSNTSDEEKNKALRQSDTIHKSFKSSELIKAEKALEDAKKLKNQKLVNKLQGQVRQIQIEGNALDNEKVLTMKTNMPLAWEAAQNISKRLNNSVSPDKIFAQMSLESNYFTKPVANLNFLGMKIKTEDRKKLKALQKP